MRFLITAMLMLGLVAPAAVHAQATPTGAPKAAPKFSTERSTIAELLANPEAKAVVEKHVPLVMSNANAMASSTLKDFHNEAPNMLPDETLAKIDAELAKIK